MKSTPADMKEYPNSYVFVVDMPGLKSGDIKVQVDEDNVLMVCGERQRGVEKVGIKFVRMERNGKFMWKFVLCDNANLETIKAVCQDGVLTVTVEKLPPLEPKKPKIIQHSNELSALYSICWSSNVIAVAEGIGSHSFSLSGIYLQPFFRDWIAHGAVR
ncbi:17.3 kDa class II heat shock protein-like [Heracleum sosnowskyi]|uniref:17.3 kDa class II heat shock protein-like n=1 Tax=Heracleum sosnowskyi TaxID=360622 RepID=A0AAD8H0M5_9APIA|nr:17.3 kDa class II heat shock protein-like [Heracleum sosnowskyi]